VLGPDHPYTLTIRGNLARFLGEGGRAEEAVAQLQPVLEDRRRVLGPDHRLTLTTRHNLGRFLGQGGRVQEAMAQLRAVLEDRLRVVRPPLLAIPIPMVTKQPEIAGRHAADNEGRELQPRGVRGWLPEASVTTLEPLWP